MTTGEIASIVAVAGTVLSFLGITGVDSSIVSQAVTGVIAIISIGAAVWSHYTRPTA